MGGKEEEDKRYCTQQQKKWSKKRLVPSLAATEEEDGTAANLVRFIYPKSHAPSIERVASQKGRDGPPPIASGWSAQHHSSSPFHKRVEQAKFFPAKEKNKPHDRVLFPAIHCLYAAWFNGLANSLLCDTRRKGCICKTRITHLYRLRLDCVHPPMRHQSSFVPVRSTQFPPWRSRVGWCF